MAAPKEEMSSEKLVELIKHISTSMKLISTSKLKQETVIALIADKTKLSKRDIKLVLDNLDKLESIWLKK